MADPAFTAEHCCGTSCEGPQILHCLVAGLYGAYPYNVVLCSARVRLDVAAGRRGWRRRGTEVDVAPV